LRKLEALAAAGLDDPAVTALNATKKFELLCRACRDNKPNLARRLVTVHGASVQAADCDSPLFRAAEGGNEALVVWLLEAGADPNGTCLADSEALTPLRAAAYQGNVGVLKLLLDAGARVNDVFGESRVTALWQSVSRNEIEAARLLLSRGGEPNAVNVDGDTPLMCAVYDSNLAMVQLLLPVTDVLRVDAKGRSVLHFAASQENDEMDAVVQHFVDAGIGVDIATGTVIHKRTGKETTGFTPLHCACVGGNYHAVKRLLEAAPCCEFIGP
jgi:ankyrin repeat protein